jgi:hypothetical protein
MDHFISLYLLQFKFYVPFFIWNVRYIYIHEIAIKTYQNTSIIDERTASGKIQNYIYTAA